MKIANLNKKPSRIDFYHDVACMYPNTLLSEVFLLASGTSCEIIAYIDLEKMPDIIIIDEVFHFYQNQPEFLKQIEFVKNSHDYVQKLIRKKVKDLPSLKVIGQYRSILNKLRKQLKEYFILRLTEFKLFELVGFADDESWYLAFPLGDMGKNKEDEYIPTLITGIKENEFILSFDSVVEQLFEYVDINMANDAPCDFIKIPLWDFPLLNSLKFNQVKHTQQDLKPSVNEFTTHFDALSQQLFQMPFTSKNQAEIIALAKEKILEHASPVQQAIDTSLYLTQLRNQSPPNTGMKFHLGITSAENLVNYFERAEIIEPYVAAETKEKLSRHINLQATCMFCYYIIQKPVEGQAN